MIDGFCQIKVSEIARIRFLIQVPETRITGTPVDGLAVDLRFEPGNSRRYFPSIDSCGLCDTGLTL